MSGDGWREEEEGMFNLLIQFPPMLVILPPRKGGQMEHAARNTLTKSHFLSTSQSLSLSLLHLCVYLSLHRCLSVRFLASTLHFSCFPPSAHWLTPTPSILQPCENEKPLSPALIWQNLQPADFVFAGLECCLEEKYHQNKPEKWDNPYPWSKPVKNNHSLSPFITLIINVIGNGIHLGRHILLRKVKWWIFFI